jgi:hypothetical protein
MFQYSRTRFCYSFGLPSTMRPRQDPHNAATNLSGRDYGALGIVALATALFALVAYRPSHLYFFGDTWDILCEFHEQG